MKQKIRLFASLLITHFLVAAVYAQPLSDEQKTALMMLPSSYGHVSDMYQSSEFDAFHYMNNQARNLAEQLKTVWLHNFPILRTRYFMTYAAILSMEKEDVYVFAYDKDFATHLRNAIRSFDQFIVKYIHENKHEFSIDDHFACSIICAMNKIYLEIFLPAPTMSDTAADYFENVKQFIREHPIYTGAGLLAVLLAGYKLLWRGGAPQSDSSSGSLGEHGGGSSGGSHGNGPDPLPPIPATMLACFHQGDDRGGADCAYAATYCAKLMLEGQEDKLTNGEAYREFLSQHRKRIVEFRTDSLLTTYQRSVAAIKNPPREFTHGALSKANSILSHFGFKKSVNPTAEEKSSQDLILTHVETSREIKNATEYAAWLDEMNEDGVPIREQFGHIAFNRWIKDHVAFCQLGSDVSNHLNANRNVILELGLARWFNSEQDEGTNRELITAQCRSDWLQANEIEQTLLSSFKNTENVTVLMQREYGADGAANYFAIDPRTGLPNITNDTSFNIEEKVRRLRNNNIAQYVIMNLGNAHWIAIKVTKEKGEVVLKVTDSLGTDRTNDHRVRKIYELFTKYDFPDPCLKEQFSSKIASLKNVLINDEFGGDRVRSSAERLNEIIVIALRGYRTKVVADHAVYYEKDDKARSFIDEMSADFEKYYTELKELYSIFRDIQLRENAEHVRLVSPKVRGVNLPGDQHVEIPMNFQACETLEKYIEVLKAHPQFSALVEEQPNWHVAR